MRRKHVRLPADRANRTAVDDPAGCCRTGPSTVHKPSCLRDFRRTSNALQRLCVTRADLGQRLVKGVRRTSRRAAMNVLSGISLMCAGSDEGQVAQVSTHLEKMSADQGVCADLIVVRQSCAACNKDEPQQSRTKSRRGPRMRRAQQFRF